MVVLFFLKKHIHIVLNITDTDVFYHRMNIFFYDEISNNTETYFMLRVRQTIQLRLPTVATVVREVWCFCYHSIDKYYKSKTGVRPYCT